MLRERAKATRRRAILEAADRMFAEKPYQDVLLEDVAAAAEVAKGTLYLYFENKEQLYLTLMQQSLGPFVQDLNQRCDAMADAPAIEVIHAIVTAVLNFVAAKPAVQYLLRVTTEAAREAVLKEHGDALAALIQKNIERGVARGEMIDRDAATTTQFVLAMISRCPMIIRRRTGPCAASAQCLAQRIVELLGSGVNVSKPLQRRGKAAQHGRADATPPMPRRLLRRHPAKHPLRSYSNER